MAHTNLAAAIQSLYTELHKAMTTIDVKDGLNLRYDSVEVELAMEMGESDELGGGAKFWVVEANGKKASEHRVTHTMRINLTPVAEAGSPLRLSPLAALSACETSVPGSLSRHEDEAVTPAAHLVTHGAHDVIAGRREGERGSAQ